MKQHKNLYFILAIGALLFAGDLMWWQAQNVGAQYEYENAAIVSAVFRSPGGKASRLDRDLNAVEAQFESGLNALEAQSQ